MSDESLSSTLFGIFNERSRAIGWSCILINMCNISSLVMTSKTVS